MTGDFLREVAVVAIFAFVLGLVVSFTLMAFLIDRFFQRPRSLHNFAKHYIDSAPLAQIEIDELCSVCKHRRLIENFTLTIPEDHEHR